MLLNALLQMCTTGLTRKRTASSSICTYADDRENGAAEKTDIADFLDNCSLCMNGPIRIATATTATANGIDCTGNYPTATEEKCDMAVRSMIANREALRLRQKL